MQENSANHGAHPVEPRLVALDGLRGLMTLLVVVSHYFGEIRHGIRATMFAWIAVDMFFVLSGYLIGKLILERKNHGNFFAVFYLRRFFRIIPVYILVICTVYFWISRLPSWTDTPVHYPLWAYLTFTQNFFMIDAGSIGAHWLAPTWTLAVEEHFYLIVPALLVFTPSRWLPWILGAAAFGAVALRAALNGAGPHADMASLVLLPARADVLVFGLLGALLVVQRKIDLAAHLVTLRLAPLVCAVGVVLLRLAAPSVVLVFTPTLAAIGCIGHLLAIVHGAPGAKLYEARWLRFLGDNGYCIYLTHLPVLGLMHGLLLGAQPDLATPQQWLVTMAALPVAIFTGWALTKLIEEPAMRFARRWRWSPPRSPSSARGVRLAPTG
jgi:peptidoglycan/LPS O-acetylase OafA/YrhL